MLLEVLESSSIFFILFVSWDTGILTTESGSLARLVFFLSEMKNYFFVRTKHFQSNDGSREQRDVGFPGTDNVISMDTGVDKALLLVGESSFDEGLYEDMCWHFPWKDGR
jgi:hypothetical protein